MRTTLKLDEDVLAAARAIAQAQQKTLGDVVSELARKGLTPVREAPKFCNDVPLMPVRPGAGPVTLELVNRLRDELP